MQEEQKDESEELNNENSDGKSKQTHKQLKVPNIFQLCYNLKHTSK